MNGKWKTALGTAGLTALGLWLFWRPFINRASDRFLRVLLTDPYSENLWELFSAASRTGFQKIAETSLRAHTGKLILRPIGGPRQLPAPADLTFNFAQLSRLPTPEEVPVDTEVVIGPGARRPLRVNMPILISGMAYGLALS